MQSRVALLGALVLILAAGVVAWLMLGRPIAPEPTAPIAVEPGGGGRAQAEAPLPPGEGTAVAGDGGGPARGRAGRKAFPSPENRVDPAVREALLQEIRERLARRVRPPAAGSAAAQAGAEEPVAGTLSKEYIQQSIREILPLVKECYELALAEDPELSAKVTVRFEVVADEERGGLVASSEILPDEARPAPSPLLAECVQETMYALKLPPPEGGGTVTVNYPFIFRADR